MFNAMQAFGLYWISSLMILLTFTYLYVKLTPYNEFKMMQSGKMGPAITLSGAMLGFALPIYSVIVHSGHLQEMIVWAVFSALVQFVAYQITRFIFSNFETIIDSADGKAVAVFLATLSVVLGLLTAACVTP